MRVAWMKQGGAAGAIAFALFVCVPVKAQESAPGMTRLAAEELTRRSRSPQNGQSGLSEKSVRVMTTYAFSLIPDQVPGSDGKMAPVDKTDPNKFVIPEEDARRVIRAATRTAYAEICGMPELSEANFEAMMAQEQAQKAWNRQQVLMIEALHLFAASYFTGNAKIIEEPETAEDGTETASGAAENQEFTAPKPPKCPPEQKQKVKNAINAYVQAAQAN